MKYAWIDAQTNRFALAEMCDTLEVSISGYRAWKRMGQFGTSPALAFLPTMGQHIRQATLREDTR